MSTMETPPPDTPRPPGPARAALPALREHAGRRSGVVPACGAAAGTEVVEARGWRVPLYLGGGLTALAVIGVILAIVALACRNDVVAGNPTRHADAVRGGAARRDRDDAAAGDDDAAAEHDAGPERRRPIRTPTRRPEREPTPSPTETATPDAERDRRTRARPTAAAARRSRAGRAADGDYTIIIESSSTAVGRREGRPAGAGQGPVGRRHPRLETTTRRSTAATRSCSPASTRASRTPRPRSTACARTSTTPTCVRSRRKRPTTAESRSAARRASGCTSTACAAGVDASTSTGISAAIEPLSAPRS